MRTQTWQAVLLVAAIGSVAALIVFRPAPTKKSPEPLTIGQIAQRERRQVDTAAGKPEAKAAYSGFIDKWKSNPDKEVQDEVGAARMRLAYAVSKDKSYEQARKVFTEAAAEYKGTGIMDADFGGIKDQALYQAAVCLSAEGKKEEARKALVDFIRSQPLSPLVNAAYKRIVKMDGKATPEDDALLQSALSKQEKQIRFETSVCGPKAAVFLLRREGKGDFDYRQLAKECGTSDQGTTLDGLRSGLKAHGLEYFGFEVSRADLRSIQTPAVLLLVDHYLVVTSVKGEVLTAFDPMTGRERPIDFSKVPAEQASAAMLLKAPPGAESKP